LPRPIHQIKEKDQTKKTGRSKQRPYNLFVQGVCGLAELCEKKIG
jgi:hypothetical protein